MNSVCILIDDSILNHHHGVRRYIFGLANSIRHAYTVTICLATRNAFYRFEPTEDQVRDNGFGDHLYARGRANIIDRLKRDGDTLPNHTFQWENAVAGDCDQFDYDIIILGAPWIDIETRARFTAKHNVCIAYDAIPCIYSIERPEDFGLRLFAMKHASTYKRYAAELGGLWAISEAAAEQCKSACFDSDLNVRVLPPFLPCGFEEPMNFANLSQPAGVMTLAAPFDFRKGFEKIPAIIKNTPLKRLNIFGGFRCPLENILAFFHALDIEEIDFFLSASTSTQRAMYLSSNVLLFPSLNEGLGLPVLEAYSCGCDVLVSDIDPLNRLVRDRRDVLSGDQTQDAKALHEKLQPRETESRLDLHLYATNRWGHKPLLSFLSHLDNR
jgi:glycosyltransferase involved in cell wall biosynthesis